MCMMWSIVFSPPYTLHIDTVYDMIYCIFSSMYPIDTVYDVVYCIYSSIYSIQYIDTVYDVVYCIYSPYVYTVDTV